MNDLIGLQYKWGASPDDGLGFTDCFQLFCAARRRLGLYDYATDFAWAYENYEENALPPLRMARWLLQNANRTLNPSSGCAAMLGQRSALGTMTNGGIICIAPRGRSVSIALSSKTIKEFNWFKPKADA
jgi:hypothetical protein